ncbi:hypothetical protein AKO1_013561 [Acrasis kona]|uniref:Uncharacterized protein n=1 Tax=Acrasis kona TaxID=1008807 RepID=A0AAW2ZHQ0_9EUKA
MSDSQPGMIHGHVQYAKGAAEEVIGNITGSEEWKKSGQQDKEAAINEMHEAKQLADKETDYSDRNKSVLNAEGKAESALGRAVGCEGMVENGEEKKHASE